MFPPSLALSRSCSLPLFQFADEGMNPAEELLLLANSISNQLTRVLTDASACCMRHCAGASAALCALWRRTACTQSQGAHAPFHLPSACYSSCTAECTSIHDLMVSTWRLLCSSFLILTSFLNKDYNILQQKELHRSV